MADTGLTAVGTGASSDWTNPSNITAADDTYATASRTVVQGSGTCGPISGYNCGFAIPSGATINGIYVEIHRKASSTLNWVKDSTLYLRDTAGTNKGSNYADTSTSWPTTEATKTYGGAADLWGTSWTDSDINDSDFGINLVTSHNPSTAVSAASVDVVKITVYYTASGYAHTVTRVAGASISTVNGIAIASISTVLGV